MSRLRAVIRVDGGPRIGFGHAIRSASLGVGLRSAGFDVAVVSRELSEDLRSHFTAVGLTTRPTVDEDPVDVIFRPEPDIVVVDGYQLGGDLARVANRGVAVVAIDDNHELPVESAQLVVNQNLHATPAMYPEVGEDRLLIGPTFAMLRPDVVAARNVPRPRLERVLVTFGGSDPLRLTRPVVEGLLALDELDLLVAAPIGHPDREWLLDRAARDHRIVVDRGDLVRSLERASLAVTAGGTTLYELACIGIPAVAVVVADNQVDGLTAAAEEGFAEMVAADPHAICRALHALRVDAARRENLSRTGRGLVDGDGARRVAQRVRELV